MKGRYEALQMFAVYIANLFYLTSDTLVYVVQDRDLSSDVAGSNKNITILIIITKFIFYCHQRHHLRHHHTYYVPSA